MCTFPRTDWDLARAAGGARTRMVIASPSTSTKPGPARNTRSPAHVMGGDGARRPGPGARDSRSLSPAPSQSLGRRGSRHSLLAAMASYGVFLACLRFRVSRCREAILGCAPEPRNISVHFHRRGRMGHVRASLPTPMHASIAMKSGRLKLRTMTVTLARAPGGTDGSGSPGLGRRTRDMRSKRWPRESPLSVRHHHSRWTDVVNCDCPVIGH